MRENSTEISRIYFFIQIQKKGRGRAALKKRHLELKDREKLERLYAKGRRVEEIAAELKVHRSTIYNELRRGDTGEMDENGRVKYSALLAQRTTLDNYRQRRKEFTDESRLS